LTSLALKSLWARKVRALGTTFAVVIGVAFVAGSFILTDTIFAAFDEIFSESLSGTSVVITAENPVKQDNGEVPTIAADLLPRVQKTAGVKLAAGAIFTPGGFFDSKGEKIGNKFAPKFISSNLPGELESLTYLEGHPPRGPTETSIDKAAAESAGLELGEKIELLTPITSPAALTKGPPEFPGLIDASVWIMSTYTPEPSLCAARLRPVPLTTPTVTLGSELARMNP